MNARRNMVLLVNIIVILVGAIIVLLNFGKETLTFEQLADEIGASIMASGIVTLFYFAYPKTNIEKEYRELTKTGLTGAYAARDLKEQYSHLLENARSKIDVLGLALNKFREDNGEIVKKKCLEGVSVRFLVMDPATEIFDVKSKEEGDKYGEVLRAPHEKLIEYVVEVNKSTEGKGKKIQMKLYKSTPATMIFRIDETMFVGPYLHARISRNTSTFRLRKGSSIFKQYADHFENLWNDSTFTRDSA